LVANFTGYFDASGAQHDEHVLTVGAVVGEVGDWKIFDEEWLPYLKEKTGSESFRMSEFAHFKGPFETGWEGNEPKRRELLGKLIELTNERALAVFVGTIVLSEWNRINEDWQAEEWFGGAYALAQANSVMRAFGWMIQHTIETQQDPADTRVLAVVEHG